jgi:hypothetical protein
MLRIIYLLTLLTFSYSCLYDPHAPEFENEYLSNVDLTSNILFYSFNEGSYLGTMDIIDSSGLNKDSETVNSPTSTLGVYGNAIEFNGTNQGIDLKPSDFNSAFSEKTVSVWYRTDKLSSDQVIYEESFISGSSTKGVTIYIEDDKVYGLVFSSTSSFWYGFTTTTKDNWHHVVLTFKGSSSTGLNFYYNGTNVGTMSVSVASFPIHSGSHAIGMVNGAAKKLNSDKTSLIDFTSGYFDGAIDEYAIWLRELSASEINVINLRQGRL